MAVHSCLVHVALYFTFPRQRKIFDDTPYGLSGSVKLNSRNLKQRDFVNA